MENCNDFNDMTLPQLLVLQGELTKEFKAIIEPVLPQILMGESAIDNLTMKDFVDFTRSLPTSQ